MFDSQLTRSPLLLNPQTSMLLVIDLQEKLLPQIPQHQFLVESTRFLIQTANLFDVPVICTQQYPKGLGGTVPEITELLKDDVRDKTMFSCRQCLEVFQGESTDPVRHQVVVAGIETHVCVLQTIMDLMSMGYDCFLAADAVGSRFSLDREVAINRMETSGVTLTTAESVAFEWCVDSKSEHFKQVSHWIKSRVR